MNTTVGSTRLVSALARASKSVIFLPQTEGVAVVSAGWKRG